MLLLLWLIFLFQFEHIKSVNLFSQNEYVITTDRVEVPSFDSNYATIEIKNFKYNRTFSALNATIEFKKDFGYKVSVAVQVFRFASNEFRAFPITLTVNLCETLQSNQFGMKNLYDCGHKSECPQVKGNYSICNWGPDYSHFPPHIPPGNYRVDMKFIYSSIQFIYVQCYWNIRTKQNKN